MKYFIIRNARKIFVALLLIVLLTSRLGTALHEIGLLLVVAGFVLSIPLLLLYRTENPIFSAIYGVAIALAVPMVYRMNDLSNVTAIDWLYSFACVGVGVFLLPAIAKRFTENFIGA